jgi:uncharacterized repeat protein (TIGR04076 family)
MKLVIKVVGIKGICPVYRVGDQWTIEQGYVLVTGESDNICMHSLASIFPYYVALSHGIKPQDLGLAKGDSREAYLQCLDPCEITGGGTVQFEVSLVSTASE